MGMQNPCRFIYQRKYCGLTCIAILFILGVGFILQIFFVSPAVEDAFNEQTRERIVMTQQAQDDNTESYQNWVSNDYDDAPLQLFEFWIYNVTNPHEVADGAFPQFREIGPFTYRRFENRSGPGNESDPIFLEDDDESVVIYDYHYHFEYQPDRSNPNIDINDAVWTISGAMMGFFSTVNDLVGSGPFILPCIDEALAAFPGHAVFYETTIHELATGIRDPWILTLDDYCADSPLWQQLKPETLYSLIADGRSRVIQHTGLKDITRITELEEYRNFTFPVTNSEKLIPGMMWDHNESVIGSRETRQFPPENWITKDSVLDIWSIEKFRVAQYVYDRDVNYKGVDLMRFRIDDAEAMACEYFYDDDCSSSITPTNPPTAEPTMEVTTIDLTFEPTFEPTTQPTCSQVIVGESATCKYMQFWEDGVWNLTNLRGSPSFMSKGRFLDAPYFINTTNIAFNLSLPEREEDDQYFDVDPRTGIVFRNFHNYQINFRFLEMDRPYLNNFTNFSIVDRLIPFAYVRVEALATDEQMEFYVETLNAMDTINNVSLYGGPILAVICFGFMFWILCKLKTGERAIRKSSDMGRLVEDTGPSLSDDAIPMKRSTADQYGSTAMGGDGTRTFAD